MINTFVKVSLKTSLLPDYVLDSTLDDYTPDRYNGINDNDDKNNNYNSNENNDDNYLYDNNDDNFDEKHDNGNDDKIKMIS